MTTESCLCGEPGTCEPHGMRWTAHPKAQGGPRPYIYDPAAGKEVVYSRVTSFISCLADRSTLEMWKRRTDLVGLTVDQTLLTRARSAHPDDRSTLDRIVNDAFTAGDGYVRTRKGTDLHKLSEYADRAETLPNWATDADVRDMLAYRETLDALNVEVLAVERRVVIDDLHVTGTFDRLVQHAGRVRIFDLKTGDVRYGLLEMAMQLAMYSRGLYYDGKTRERAPLDGVDMDTGLICHVAQGKARCTLYEVDLNVGWSGVLLAEQVRAWRRQPFTFTEVQVTDPWAEAAS